ncbi:MAG: 2-dehydropantoate 2-reductase N-terminal domain-containing protein [Acidobacteriota bacterium]
MRILVIGAGRVGCGALGVALALQGHELILALRRPELVESINRLGYDVITKGSVDTLVPVRGVRAVEMSGRAFAHEVAEADQIFTAVRPDNLPGIAPALAEALVYRIGNGITRPLDVFCCENLKNAGSQLERLIFTQIPFAFAQPIQEWVGFNAAISDRIVSGQETDAEGRLVITADATGDILFDTLQVKQDFEILPPFKGLENFPACIEEKLYVLNCGHAVCAYLGFHRGYEFIHEAMLDESIRSCVVGAMLEAQRALQCKNSRTFHYAGLINEILVSFANAALKDTISRVGRDPIRKLQADDRLIGPAKLAYRYGIDPVNLIRGCAAAILFSQKDDSQSIELKKLVDDTGVSHALDTVAQLRPWNPISRLIQDQVIKDTNGKVRN